MRKLLIKCFLSMLNGRFLNHTPCKYEFVGNLDAFSRSDIESTLRSDPDMTLQEYIDCANRFKACPISRTGVSVIEPDGTYSLNRDWRPE